MNIKINKYNNVDKEKVDKIKLKKALKDKKLNEKVSK